MSNPVVSACWFCIPVKCDVESFCIRRHTQESNPFIRLDMFYTKLNWPKMGDCEKPYFFLSEAVTGKAGAATL